MDKITIKSNRIWMSEATEDPDALFAKILICDFNTNLNGAKIDRSTIDNWLPTLVNEPLVGKIVVKSDGSKDFTSHNARLVTRIDENGNEFENVEFDTSAFGSIIEASIENVDGTDCIVATAQIWKRFVDAAQIIVDRVSNGTLNTSWEIVIESFENKIIDGDLVKVITSGRFIGHALLGEDVHPAYKCSGILSVAEKDDDFELLSAILKGLTETSNIDGEEESTSVTNEEIALSVEEGFNPPTLTDRDVRDKLGEVCRDVLNKWCWVTFVFPEEHTVWVEVEGRESELDYVLFKYDVDGDSVTVDSGTPVKLTVSINKINSTVEGLNEAVSSANGTIESLNDQIKILEPYRIAHEQAEAERIRKEREAAISELKQYVTDSGKFTSDEIEGEALSALIENLDRSTINGMIAERIVSEARKRKDGISTSSSSDPEVKVSLQAGDAPTISKSITVGEFRKYLWS